MSDEHELARFSNPAADDSAADWVEATGAHISAAAGVLLRAGMAVRLSSVGYGRALRFSATDSRGWSCGWTVASHDELLGLCRGLCAQGGAEYVERLLEKPSRPGRR